LSAAWTLALGKNFDKLLPDTVMRGAIGGYRRRPAQDHPQDGFNIPISMTRLP
jgi:hypothetical protein